MRRQAIPPSKILCRRKAICPHSYAQNATRLNKIGMLCAEKCRFCPNSKISRVQSKYSDLFYFSDLFFLKITRTVAARTPAAANDAPPNAIALPQPLGAT